MASMTPGSWTVVGPAVSRSGIGDLFSRSEHSSVGWSCRVLPVSGRAGRVRAAGGSIGVSLLLGRLSLGG